MFYHSLKTTYLKNFREEPISNLLLHKVVEAMQRGDSMPDGLERGARLQPVAAQPRRLRQLVVGTHELLVGGVGRVARAVVHARSPRGSDVAAASVAAVLLRVHRRPGHHTSADFEHGPVRNAATLSHILNTRKYKMHIESISLCTANYRGWIIT